MQLNLKCSSYLDLLAQQMKLCYFEIVLYIIDSPYYIIIVYYFHTQLLPSPRIQAVYALRYSDWSIIMINESVKILRSIYSLNSRANRYQHW